MKKNHIILLFMLALGNLSLFSQSFAFYLNQTKLEDNAEITVNAVEYTNYGSDSSPVWYALLESNLSLVNSSAMTINAVANQIVETTPTYGEISFCFGNCVTTNANKTLETAIAPTNTTALHLSFSAEKNFYTTTRVKYVVANKLDNSDKRTVTINYVYQESTGITPISGRVNKFFTSQYGRNIVGNYQFDSAGGKLVRIATLSGRVTEEFRLENISGKFEIPVHFSSGIYLLTVSDDKAQTVLSRKILVK
jgi:hypothetical protein